MLVSLPNFSAGPCEQGLYLSSFCTPNTNPSSLNVTEASEQLVCGLDCVSLHHAHFFSLGCHCINTLPMKWTVSIHLVRTTEYSAAGRELKADNTKMNFTLFSQERESHLWFLEEVISVFNVLLWKDLPRRGRGKGESRSTPLKVWAEISSNSTTGEFVRNAAHQTSFETYKIRRCKVTKPPGANRHDNQAHCWSVTKSCLTLLQPHGP